MKLNRVHHLAIIAAHYQASKRFYCDVLGCELLGEVYRAERDSWMGDLALNGEYLIELFNTRGAPPPVDLPKSIGNNNFRAARLGPAIRRPPGCVTSPSRSMPSIRPVPS